MLTFRHLTSAHQLLRSDTDFLISVAAEMEKVVAKGGNDALKGKILAALFYEPSTRTRLSFEAAMLRLGGQVITADGLQFSSMYKGETIEDTMMVVGRYADIICMRHPDLGSADKAAAVAPVPFINAGDGPGQHPTQALLDLYTIHKSRGSLEGVTVSFVGDLKFGRTVHSLAVLLSLYEGVSLQFISPKELPLPEKVTKVLDERKVKYSVGEDIREGLESDFLYMTRVQQERFEDKAEYERLKLKYILTPEHLTKSATKVLHPLPRVGEISPAVDALPNALYFQQVSNGVVMRMAILQSMLAS